MASRSTSTISPSADSKGKKVSENIYLGTDGKYHWYYELKLMSNPTILYTVWKVLILAFFITYLYVLLLNSCSGNNDWEDVWGLTKVFFYLTLFVLVLGALSYVIYAATVGWKYCVLFEMDEHGVNHTMLPKQFKKAQALSMIQILAGVATKNVGAVGRGLMTAQRQSLYSSWASTRSVEINRRHNVIKVNERLFKNQVYAADEDFDFVADYICAHVDSDCKVSRGS